MLDAVIGAASLVVLLGVMLLAGGAV